MNLGSLKNLKLGVGERLQYDPWTHAKELGVRVEYYNLKANYGLWVPQQNLILIRPRMRTLMERSVLAHEVVHAEYCDPPFHNSKFEARANRIAAERLINPKAYAELARIYGDGDLICRELGVSRELLQAYIKKIA